MYIRFALQIATILVIAVSRVSGGNIPVPVEHKEYPLN